MNIKEWQKACKEGCAPRKYDNLCRAEQKSLKYNPDPKATVRHHLRDTEEQRQYNDEHYEMWGFNEDGTFEYGKYIVFVTEEQHNKIHHHSEETRKKISISRKKYYSVIEHRILASKLMKLLWQDDDFRIKTTLAIQESHSTQEYRDKISAILHSPEVNDKLRKAQEARWTIEARLEWSKKFSGENNYMYGKTLSYATRELISLHRSGKCTGKDHWLYGKHHSKDTLLKISEKSRSYWSDEDHRKQQSLRCTGRKQTPEHIAKRTAKLIGHETSEETRLKISVANSGRVFSEEHKQKLSIARQQRIITDETKEKTSTTMKKIMSSDEHRKRISDTVKKRKQEMKLLYNDYKLHGGILMWNDFQSFLKHKFKPNYIPTLLELQKALVSDEDDIEVNTE